MADQNFWERERTSSPDGKNSNTQELNQNPHRVSSVWLLSGAGLNIPLVCGSRNIQGRVVVQPASELDYLKQKMEDLETLRKYCGAKMETHLS